MSAFIPLGISLLLVAGCVHHDGEETMQSSTTPIACALAPDDHSQRSAEIEALFAGKTEVRELPDGYAFRFPGEGDWAGRLLRLIEAERQCCPFFEFELSFEPDQGPVWFHVRGSDEAKAFLATLVR